MEDNLVNVQISRRHRRTLSSGARIHTQTTSCVCVCVGNFTERVIGNGSTEREEGSRSVCTRSQLLPGAEELPPRARASQSVAARLFLFCRLFLQTSKLKKSPVSLVPSLFLKRQDTLKSSATQPDTVYKYSVALRETFSNIL